jgi:glycosyltransferase involved in cell wall biosynthesis
MVVIVPGSIEARTGGYEYDRRMIAGLRARGLTVDVRELDASFPRPTPPALTHAAGVLAAIPDGATVVIDGLAFGAMPDEAERESSRLRFVAVVHLPLAAEVGLDPATVGRLESSERRSLAAAARVVVTGQTTADVLVGYGVTRDRIAVVEPGTDAAPIARGSGGGSGLHLVSAAMITPRKGHEILLRALAKTAHRDWRLTCAGSLERDPPTADRVRACLRALDLESRVSLAGELDDARLAALYDSADLFVLATLHESYGMAVAEALARGLPVVSTATGAIPQLVGADAGILVPPGDVDALADALSSVMGDARLRARLAEGARRVRRVLPTWEDATTKMAAVLEDVRLPAQRSAEGKPDATSRIDRTRRVE